MSFLLILICALLRWRESSELGRVLPEKLHHSIRPTGEVRERRSSHGVDSSLAPFSGPALNIQRNHIQLLHWAGGRDVQVQGQLSVDLFRLCVFNTTLRP